MPALVLVGRDDILTPPAFSRELARIIPRARLKILPGGHGFFIEEADPLQPRAAAIPQRSRAPSGAVRLQGKTAIVTGSTKGIGFAIARAVRAARARASS